MTDADDKLQVLAIVQARMGSERLPGKVMMKVDGRPLIDWHIDRLMRSSRLHRLVVATTSGSSDDVLVEHLENRGVTVFRGKENDVLNRFADCAAQYPSELITRTTADCPLVDPDLFDALIENFENRDKNCHHSYISLACIPRGFDVEIMTSTALMTANNESDDPYEREHVTPFLVRRPERFNSQGYCPPIDAAEYRLCVDVQKDLEVIKALSTKTERPLYEATANEIIEVLRSYPQVGQINGDVIQRNSNRE